MSANLTISTNFNMCKYCGTDKKKFRDGTCSVCGNFGLEQICFSSHPEDNDILFDPSDNVRTINQKTKMSYILCEAKIFESISEADRNGWKNKFVPFGWSDIIVGKRPKTKRIFIWNPQLVENE